MKLITGLPIVLGPALQMTLAIGTDGRMRLERQLRVMYGVLINIGIFVRERITAIPTAIAIRMDRHGGKLQLH